VAGVAAFLPTSAARAAGQLPDGDVFVSVSNGQVEQWHPNGGTSSLVASLDTTTGGYTTGSTFDSAGNFYVTDFSAGAVTKFDPNGTLIGGFGGGYSNPESILWNQDNSAAYVGNASSNQILQFDTSGNAVASYAVATEDRGADWIDLDADQCTMYYTSEGSFVHRFDVCTNTQGSNVNSVALPGSTAYEFHKLPASSSFDPNGYVIADSQSVAVLDPSGTLIADYAFPGEGCLFALALDPDGVHAWAGDFCSADVLRFDLSTGVVDNTFNPGTGGQTVFGISVKGRAGGVNDVATRYAPYVWLDPIETTFPDSTQHFIANSQLRWSNYLCTDDAVKNPDGSDATGDAIDQSRLGEQAGANAYGSFSKRRTGFLHLHCGAGTRFYLANEFTRPYDGSPDRVTDHSEGMFLNFPNDLRGGNPNLSADPVYYDYSPGHYVVYWFFYDFDDWALQHIQQHEGDWEHIAVHLDANNQATQVAFYRHGCDPRIISWQDLESGAEGQLQDGTHPVVYSGLGSHASYPTAGVHGGGESCQPAPDVAGAGSAWSTWTNMLQVRAQPWYGFGGAWGEVGNFDFSTGPLGPSVYKGTGAPSGW
jgi:hypothetical protein